VDSQLPDGSLARGDLWRFTVADYLVVDDFESYTDAAADLIFLAWHDGLGYDDPKDGFPGNGSGSTVGHLEVPYAEQSIVHSGSQAMPLYYNNQDSVGFSQADRTYTSPSDWTRRGVRHLQVHFAGQPGNTLGVSDTLYVRLVDQEGREFIQHYTDAGGAGALQVTEWQSWFIPLSAVSQQGLNLHSLTRLSLGIGDPLAPQAGGTGIVYIDDIRLTID
jgi:hypothetical protein